MSKTLNYLHKFRKESFNYFTTKCKNSLHWGSNIRTVKATTYSWTILFSETSIVVVII